MKPMTVFQIGPQGEVPGGIAQVVNEYLSWHFEHVTLVSARSTMGKGDRLAPFRTFAVALRLISSRVRNGPRSVAAVHFSQRGSFVREGALMVLASLLGFGTCAHLHGSSFVTFASKHPRFVATVLRRAGAVLALTDATATSCAELLPGARIYKIKNAISVPARIHPKLDQVVFGGVVGTRKGADTLISAWRQVAPRAGNWRLILAGPIADVRPEEGDPSVTYAGALPHAELMELLSKSAVAVLPSRAEALPMFLLEAMARGCAVVATRVGHVPSLVEGAGLLVTAGDADELAAAMTSIINDADMRTSLATNGLTRIATQYDSATLAAELERIWRHAWRGTPSVEGTG